MSDEVSLYGSNAVTSGDLTDDELALLENDATILDNGVPVNVTVEDVPEDTPEDTPQDKNTEDGNAEDKPQDTDKVDQKAVQEKVTQSRQALDEIGADLSTKGVDPEALLNEYNSKGELSQESYAKLAEAGYSKAIVDAIIAGQAAAADSFSRAILDHAGGPDAFKALTEFAQTNSPATVAAYNAAIERQDIATATALLDGLKASRDAKFGTRNPQIEARPTPAASAKVQGYASQSEMIAAMSDPRYSRDRAYTQEVERKVQASTLF